MRHEQVQRSIVKYLDLENKSIEKMEGLHVGEEYKALYLKFNRISKIEGLEEVPYITFLDLAYNQIETIEGLEASEKLNSLYVSDNKIKFMRGYESLVNLEYLGLSGNQIETIEGLEEFEHLRVVHLAYNPLKKITRASLEHIQKNNITIHLLVGRLEDLEVID